MFLILILTRALTSLLDLKVLSVGSRDVEGGESSVQVGGKEVSKQLHGYNIVVLDESTGALVESKNFDTSKSTSATLRCF
jgi:hypothetical protein